MRGLLSLSVPLSLFLCLSASIYLCLSASISVSLSFSLGLSKCSLVSVCMTLCVCLYLCLSFSLKACLSVCVILCVSVSHSVFLAHMALPVHLLAYSPCLSFSVFPPHTPASRGKGSALFPLLFQSSHKGRCCPRRLFSLTLDFRSLARLGLSTPSPHPTSKSPRFCSCELSSCYSCLTPYVGPEVPSVGTVHKGPCRNGPWPHTRSWLSRWGRHQGLALDPSLPLVP